MNSSSLEVRALKVFARVADVLDDVETGEALDDGDEVVEALQRGRRPARLEDEPSIKCKHLVRVRPRP